MISIREKNKYRAYSILRKYISFNVSDGDKQIEELAINLFNKKVKNIPKGMLLASVIDDLSKNRYSESYQRFLFKRTYSGQEELITLYPYGFLLNQAYENYYNKGCIIIDTSNLIDETKKIAEAIYYLKDLKRYTIYELMNTSTAATLGDDLSRDVLNFYFGFFPQYSLSYIEFLLVNVLKKQFLKYDKNLEFRIIYSIYEELNKSQSILNITLNFNKMFKKYSSEISEEKFYSFIDNFAYTESKKSEKFEFSHLNYLFIKDGSSYKIPLKSMNITGLYKQAYVYLLEFDKKLSLKIGSSIENSVSKLFTEKGFECYSGYWFNNKRPEKPWYESDLILDLPKSILLIEIKKASMKLESKNGDIYNSLLDIKKAFLESQIQALRLREKLEREKSIKLYFNKIKDQNYKEIQLNNKKIITLSLTLEEFDILHCKSLCGDLIKSFLFIEKITTDPKQKEEDALNKSIAQLKQIDLNLEKLRGEGNIMSRYYYLLFFNIQLIYHLLKQINTPEELESKLVKFCSVLSDEDVYNSL